MEKGIGTIVAVIIGLAVVFGTRYLRKSDAGGEYKQQVVAMMQEVEGYSANPDYFKWLAESSHDAVFDDCYSEERVGRRRYRAVIDEDKYLRDFFAHAIQQATTDNAPQVAAALTKYRDANFGPGGE